jgi:hypothetical protein
VLKLASCLTTVAVVLYGLSKSRIDAVHAALGLRNQQSCVRDVFIDVGLGSSRRGVLRMNVWRAVDGTRRA